METAQVEIVLVEDSAEDAELAIRALRKRKLANRLQHVTDGAAALDLLLGKEAPTPHVVLLDLKLPKVSGLEVLAALRKDDRTKKLPVVVLTSSKEDADLEEAYRLGANSYVVKPVDFDNFSTAVGELGFYWVLLNEMPQ